jgi:hypothetical protein
VNAILQTGGSNIVRKGRRRDGKQETKNKKTYCVKRKGRAADKQRAEKQEKAKSIGIKK